MPDPMLPLGADGVNSLGAWQNRRDAARATVDRLKVEWDKNLDRYLAKRPLTAYKDEVIVPKDFANVEQKKSQLAFQTPQIQLEPLQPGLDAAVTTFEAVINNILGPDGVHADAMVDEVLSDALIASGVFGTKICYEAVIDGMRPLAPDPNTPPPMGAPGMPSASGLPPTPSGAAPPMAPGAPVMSPQLVPNVISEKYVWQRISPAKLLIPDDFTGSDYDDAPWLGFDFLMDFTVAKAQFNLPDDFNAFAGDDDHLLGRQRPTADQRNQSKKVRGSEIWYKASIFDETVKNPDQMRQIVLIDGMDNPVVHRDSPYQYPGPNGKLEGMPGFPVHIGALRYVPDSAFPPSDCSMSKAQVEELSKGRTNMIRQRERSVPMRFADLQRVGGEEGLAKIEKNILQGIVPLPMANIADPPIFEIARAQFPRENFEFDNIANRDIAEIWAMDSNQRGVSTTTERTATELQIMQNNANVRLDKERTKFLKWFSRGVTKLASLIQQFATDDDYVTIVGPDGQKQLAAWNKDAIQGRFLFKAKPDSSVRIDAAQERAQALQLWNLLANSPFANVPELLAELLRKFNLDPAKIIVQPQPKPAEVPKISYAFNDQSLNPLNPAFPLVVEILKQGGIILDNEAIAAAQRLASLSGPTASAVPMPNPPQPVPARDMGPAAPGPLNKHAMDQTGDRPGPKIGGQAPPVPGVAA